METNQNQNNPQMTYPDHNENQKFLQSTTARVIMVGLLTLVLLLPLQYVKSLIWERQTLQETVTDGIASQWGGKIYFYGPILKVPYSTIYETEVTDKISKKTTVQRTATTDFAYFFPEQLTANTGVITDSRYRNNYETTVFNANMKFNGNYKMSDFSSKNILPQNIHWDKASIIINTNSLKSIKGAVAIKLNNHNYNFEPIAQADTKNSQSTLETTPINLAGITNGTLPFNLDIIYDGTQQISIVPIGKLTEVNMKSNWLSPGFTGAFSPYKRHVDNKGFTASWKVSHLNRQFVQQYFEALPDLEQYAFNIDFLIPVNEYQQNERAAKYGFLVIGLTFLIFFLIQTISKISIHLFQYGMIGVALIMFYTLLIAITEHSSFRLAYIIAGIAVVVMISLYSISILKNKKFPLFIAASLTGLYTFIYIIIQLENYALLAGSIGLFLILGAVMYFSRKIDWNNSHSQSMVKHS